MCSLTADSPNRRARRDELEPALSPHVLLRAQVHADDTIGAEAFGFGLHPTHCEFACGVHGLREHGQFLVLSPPADLDANVVDRRADDEAQRLEARLIE